MDQKRKIILASASPRRKELLEKIGLAFTTDPGNYPEELPSRIPNNKECSKELTVEDLVKSISTGKAMIVGRKYRDALIIAADTIGVLRGKIIGKPKTEEEAKEMLQAMSGKSHRVITGFTILDSANHKMVTHAVETRVYFKKLSRDEIDRYVKTGEPMDKAGAYAIQGLGAVLVEKIVGDYYNVMGLPLSALATSLKEFGVNVL